MILSPLDTNLPQYKRNFDPHRVQVNGRSTIKKSLRPFYPYIEKPTSQDVEQEEHPWEARPIDVAVIREWLMKCDEIHGSHCRGPAGHSARPSFLIDVKRMCLVPAADHAYVALSYVWGQASCVSLTSRTRTRLLASGSLSQEPLPDTIKQALQQVALLGQTHLWVDRLCIDQDDGSSKKAQIAAMADIYANSYLTIAAAEGKDASEPLCSRGLRDSTQGGDIIVGSAPKDEPERPISPTSPRSIIMEDLSWSLVTSSVWSTRGWTFQEYYSSRRKLIFHRNTVTWECHCEAWNEIDQYITTRQCQATPKSSTTTGFDLSPWPDLHRFVRLVCLFNVRHLSYQSDAINAIEGLLTVFSTVFEGGFISGLPQMVFDAALLWQPYFPMERRKPTSEMDNAGIPPSWSYFGYSGSLHSEDIVAGFNFVIHEDEDMQLPSTHTISAVNWTHSMSRNGPKIPITVSAAEYRDKYRGKHEDLPPGWHAMESTHAANARADHSDPPTYYFWHDNDPTQRFWYPVPIRDPTSPSTPSHRPRFLHGRTQLATDLQLVAMYPRPSLEDNKSKNPERCADALIRTNNGSGSDGEWIGYMRLNRSVASINTTSPESRAEKNCKLIELSRGSTVYHERLLDRYVEYLYPEMRAAIPRDEVYEFVNVMWIEMADGGVARRVAVGRVLKSAWARLAKVDVDVTIC